MEESGQFGNDRTVIAIDEGRNILQEPDMAQLIEVEREMTEEERERTGQYLKDKDSHEAKPKNELQLQKNKTTRRFQMVKDLRDEDGRAIEIVYCRATKCRSNLGSGKCSIVHSMGGDDKISQQCPGGLRKLLH